MSCRHAMSCHAMPCHAISYHIIPYHIIYHIISYHIISYIISYIIYHIIPTSNHWLVKSHITLISAGDCWHNWLEIVGSCTSHGSDIMSKPVSATLPVGRYNRCRCFMRGCNLYRILHVVGSFKLVDSHMWVKVWIVSPHKNHHW